MPPGYICKTGCTSLIMCGLQATKVNAGPGMAVTVAVCSLLQASAAWLAPNVYRRFGWHMYSKMACDLRLKDAEQCRKALCQLNRFGAMARLDCQVCCQRPKKFSCVGATAGATFSVLHWGQFWAV